VGVQKNSNEVIIMKIGVIGLGIVGLAITASALEKGHEVVVVDIDENLVQDYERRIEEVNVNDDDIHRVELLLLKMNRDRLHLSSHYDEDTFEGVHHYMICTESSVFVSVVESLRDYINPGDVIVIESTVTPKDVKVFMNVLFEGKNINSLFDFHLIVSPERVMEGKLVYNFRSLDKVVGVMTDEAWEKAEALYRGIGVQGELHRSTINESAISKLVENTYRYWNITLANLVSDICNDTVSCSFERVRELVNSCPWRDLMLSGLGIGGPCLSENIAMLYEHAMCYTLDGMRLLKDVQTYNEVRTSMYIPEAILNDIRRAGYDLENINICVFGAAYRPEGVSTINSPALTISYELSKDVKSVFMYDPKCIGDEMSWEDCVSKSQVVLLLVPHSKLVSDFETAMMKYRKQLYINLTQVQYDDIQEGVKYVWHPI